ncbi:MAG: phosphate signaling complex protein PhoU [Proteobacteria bacterium]|nr:phosphate signaling complex protein PhoU [Pseudomonadota bacterium]
MIDLFREQHTSSQYEHELKSFFNRLLKMGFLTEEIVCTILDSFSKGPSQLGNLAEFSREGEKSINRMEIEIDQMSREICTRRAPVASDFRLMTAATKVVMDLERIGDESKRIAIAVPRVVSSEHGAGFKGSLRQIIDEIKLMINETTACLSRLDHLSALEIIAHDRVINNDYDEIYADMVSLMKTSPDKIDSALDVIWTARSIERIGDHCRNIAESVIYVVEGRDVRHPSAADRHKGAPDNGSTNSKATADEQDPVQ